MKIGDLVRFVATEPGYHEYPQYKGKLGVIVRERNKDCFFAMSSVSHSHTKVDGSATSPRQKALC